MNEKEYVNCDSNLPSAGLLSLEEIVEIVKNENKITSRIHKRKITGEILPENNEENFELINIKQKRKRK
jgi:predicted RNA-binding protein